MEAEIEDNLSEGEEPITADVVLKVIESAWLNERFAPEILPHHNDMIECMLGQIDHMEKNINKLPKTDFRLSIHKMELARIKFIISSYLRTRLEKIERYAIKILNDEEQRTLDDSNYLSPSESEYARSYLNNIKFYLENVALNKMPTNMQNFDTNKMAVSPNINCHVFLKALETVNGVILEGTDADQDEEIDLEVGSQHILQYKSIADLIKSGKVQLI